MVVIFFAEYNDEIEQCMLEAAAKSAKGNINLMHYPVYTYIRFLVDFPLCIHNKPNLQNFQTCKFYLFVA